MKDKNISKSDLILLCLGIFILLFVITMTVTFWVKDAVPDTLIQCVLGAGEIEAAMLAGIKISNIFKGENNIINDIEGDVLQ